MSEKLNQKDITLEEMFEWLERKRHNAGIDEFEHLMIDAIQDYLGYPKDDGVIYSDVDTKEADMYLQRLSL